mgnify:CR=1 FL=1
MILNKSFATVCDDENICNSCRNSFLNYELNSWLVNDRIHFFRHIFFLGVLLAWVSPSGKRLLAYGRQSYEELRRVVWPTKKETLNTTGLVMAFVVVMAFFLFVVDKLIELGLYDGLLRLSL